MQQQTSGFPGCSPGLLRSLGIRHTHQCCRSVCSNVSHCYSSSVRVSRLVSGSPCCENCIFMGCNRRPGNPEAGNPETFSACRTTCGCCPSDYSNVSHCYSSSHEVGTYLLFFCTLLLTTSMFFLELQYSIDYCTVLYYVVTKMLLKTIYTGQPAITTKMSKAVIVGLDA